MFCREDGTPLDRWLLRREFAAITKAAGLGEEWAARELRHSFVSILSAHGARRATPAKPRARRRA